MSPYAKAVVAAVVAVLIAGLQAFQGALGDGVISLEDGVTIALAVLGAIGVYFVPNRPKPGDGHRQP